jgi:branched-chain amino acid transport system substrate-binding protein
VLSGVWWSAQLAATSTLSRDFVASVKARYGGREPEWFQALGYETARALFAAIQKAGKVDREAVREALARLDMPSLLPGGRLRLDPANGQQAQNPFVVQQNHPDGTSPIVYPPDVAGSPGVIPNPRCAK